MPKYVVTAPDGKKYRVTAPDGASQADVLAYAKSHYGTKEKSLAEINPGEYDQNSQEYQAKYGPTSGSSFVQNAWEAFGSTLPRIGRGLEQLSSGLAPKGPGKGSIDYSKEQEARQLEVPLMQTAGGKIGSLTGNLALVAPTLAIPGANTAVGAGLIGGAYSLAQPATSGKERAINTALGTVISGGAQGALNTVGRYAAGRLASKEAQGFVQQGTNSERDAALRAWREAGGVVPPTAARPSALNTAAESIAGKAATRQGAEAINAPVADDLILGDLKIAGSPSRKLVKSAISKEGVVYERVKEALNKFGSDEQYFKDIANISGELDDLEKAYPGLKGTADETIAQLQNSLKQEAHDARAVELTKYLRAQAKDNFKAAFGNGGPQKLALAKAQIAASNAIENLIDRQLRALGRGGLFKDWQEARTTIAKGYQALAALKGGHFNSLRIAAQAAKGAEPTGGFKVVSDFATHFPEVARVPKSGAGVSKLAATIAGGGAGTALLLGEPTTAAAIAAASALPWTIRKGILSQAGQRMLGTPSYGPSALTSSLYNLPQKAAPYALPPSLLLGPSLVQAAQEDTL